MRRTALFLVAMNLLVLCALPSSAGDDKEAAAIIEKSIKAHFPKGMDKKKEAVRTKTKGTIHVMGLKLPYTSESSVQPPGKLKEALELDIMGKKVNVVSVYNGKEAWIRADGKDVKVTDDILAEFQDAAYMLGLMQGVFTKDKKVKYSLSGEVQVKGKPALGMVISREGKKDINLFFDKGTSLIVKVEARKRDMAGQEVTEERFITEYQAVEGRKVAKKVEILRDGKDYLTAEVTEVHILEKLDDSEFAQPK